MLSVFWLVLGYSCNNRCQGCYAAAKLNQPGQLMSLDYVCAIADEMVGLGVRRCLLIGGEPTAHPLLAPIIGQLHRRGIRTTLVTNGRRLASEPYFGSLLAAGLNRAVISIEGSTAAIHNRITRHPRSFAQTIQAIRLGTRLTRRLSTLTTIQSLNAEDCPNLPRVLQSIGVSDIGFNCAIPSVSHGGVSTDNVLPLNLTARVIEQTFKQAQRQGIHVNFNGTIPACLFERSLLDEMLATDSIAFGCQMYRGQGIAFDPDGNILPCTHFSDFPLLTGCRSPDDSFSLASQLQSVWEAADGIPGVFRRKLWQYPAPVCAECRFWGACIGGCPLFWLHEGPEAYITAEIPTEGR